MGWWYYYDLKGCGIKGEWRGCAKGDVYTYRKRQSHNSGIRTNTRCLSLMHKVIRGHYYYFFFCFICIQISFLISTFRNKKRGEYSFTKECSFFFSVLIFFDFWISVQGGEDVEKTMVPQHSTCVIRMTSSNGPLTERIEKGQEWTPANPRNSRWLLYS